MEHLEALWAALLDPETPWGVFDLVFGAVLLLAFVRGLFRGLPNELAEGIGTVLMFLGGMHFYAPFSEWILSHTRLEDPTASRALAYTVIVLVFLVVWKLITFLLRKVLDWSCPRQLRTFGGAVVAVLKTGVLLCIVLAVVLLSGHPVLIEQVIDQSAFGRTVEPYLPRLEEPDGSGDS